MLKTTRLSLIATTVFVLATLAGPMAHAENVDAVAMFNQAKAERHTGFARKTRPVDARPSVPGEVVVTTIKGEGVETLSKPAEAGDMVVRNRCPETGDEEYLVKAAKFPARYATSDKPAGSDGWQEFLPQGKEMNFYIIPESQQAFEFEAPWGEQMVARPGDALLQTPGDEKDTYRVAAASFACTYDIVKAP